MAIISGVAIASEILIVKHLMKFSDGKDKLDTSMLSFSLRVYSVGFIACFLLYEYFTKSEEVREKYRHTMCNNRNLITLVIAGFFSSIAVLSYYSSLSNSPSAGAVSALRLIYVPLIFAGGFIFLKEKINQIKWYGWLGVALVVLGGVGVGLGVEKENELGL